MPVLQAEVERAKHAAKHRNITEYLLLYGGGGGGSGARARTESLPLCMWRRHARRPTHARARRYVGELSLAIAETRQSASESKAVGEFDFEATSSLARAHLEHGREFFRLARCHWVVPCLTVTPQRWRSGT